MKIEKNWKLLYTKPKAEKRVCDNLTKKNIEHYCPVNNLINRSQEKGRIQTQLLFDRFVFVLIDDTEEKIVHQIEGVQHFIYWLGKPATIKSEEIDLIRNFTNKHANVQLEKIEVNLNGRTSTVYIDRQHENFEGINITQEFCKISLPSLGYALIAEIVRSGFDVLKVNRTNKYAISNFFSGSLR